MYSTEVSRIATQHSTPAHLLNVLDPGLVSEQRHRKLLRSEHVQHPPHHVIVVRQPHIRLEGGIAEIGLWCHLGEMSEDGRRGGVLGKPLEAII